jgi:hypothetical protein
MAIKWRGVNQLKILGHVNILRTDNNNSKFHSKKLPTYYFEKYLLPFSSVISVLSSPVSSTHKETEIEIFMNYMTRSLISHHKGRIKMEGSWCSYWRKMPLYPKREKPKDGDNCIAFTLLQLLLGWLDDPGGMGETITLMRRHRKCV